MTLQILKMVCIYFVSIFHAQVLPPIDQLWKTFYLFGNSYFQCKVFPNGGTLSVLGSLNDFKSLE